MPSQPPNLSHLGNRKPNPLLLPQASLLCMTLYGMGDPLVSASQLSRLIPSQPLAHPQPTHCGVGKRNTLDSGQALLSNT